VPGAEISCLKEGRRLRGEGDPAAAASNLAGLGYLQAVSVAPTTLPAPAASRAGGATQRTDTERTPAQSRPGPPPATAGTMLSSSSPLKVAPSPPAARMSSSLR